MTSKSESQFIFTVCQVGAEKALKAEIAREESSLKFAYSRPGFLTFKQEGAALPLDFSLRSVFARAYGVSIGKLSSASLPRLSDQIQSLRTPNRKLRLHVWERDLYAPGEEPLNYQPGALASRWEKLIREAFPADFETSVHPLPGETVLDVIILEDDGAWVGAHLHSGTHSRWPGGRPQISLPDLSPSRAYLKLEESLLWSGAPVRAGDIAVEIGSAPGGASYALLQRGLKVVGIDPAIMAPVVLNHPNFRHFQTPVANVLREDLPDSVQWVMLDMNVEPRISLFAVDRLASRMKDSLLGVILTIKLNQWKIANDIPNMLDHVRAMGMVRVKAAQLSSCRQEIILFGLTRKGQTRKV